MNENRMLCFVCSACCFYCPNPDLWEMGEPQIKCEECAYNSGLCEDCLFENSKECEKEKKE